MPFEAARFLAAAHLRWAVFVESGSTPRCFLLRLHHPHQHHSHRRRFCIAVVTVVFGWFGCCCGQPKQAHTCQIELGCSEVAVSVFWGSQAAQCSAGRVPFAKRAPVEGASVVAVPRLHPLAASCASDPMFSRPQYHRFPCFPNGMDRVCVCE